MIRKSNRAITLIALVITIVVMLILATIAIRLTIGENGIFKRAKQAKEEYTNSQSYEQAQVNTLDKEIEKHINGENSKDDIKYTITYDLDGGALEEGKTNPTIYTIKSEDITLNNPKKEGYTFIGWSGTGLTGNSNTTVTITKGSTENRTYTANWEEQTFTVTIYSAPVDQIYYYENTNKTILGTTDSNGKIEGITVKNGITVYSSVAKDLSNLSNPYNKTFNNINSNTTLYLMPDGDIYYWYGYNPIKFNTIVNYYPDNEYDTAATVRYDTNSIYLKTNGSDGRVSHHAYLNSTLVSAQKLSSITSAHQIATDACGPYITKIKTTQNINTMNGSNPNKLGDLTLDINNGYYKSWTYSYSGTDSGYIGFHFGGGWRTPKEATFYALWYE